MITELILKLILKYAPLDADKQEELKAEIDAVLAKHCVLE